MNYIIYGYWNTKKSIFNSVSWVPYSLAMVIYYYSKKIIYKMYDKISM